MRISIVVCQEFGQKHEFLRRQGKIKKRYRLEIKRDQYGKGYTSHYSRYHHSRTSEVSGPTLWPVWSGSSKYTFKMLGLWVYIRSIEKIFHYRPTISWVFDFSTFEIYKIVVMKIRGICFHICLKVVDNQNCCWMLPFNQWIHDVPETPLKHS